MRLRFVFKHFFGNDQVRISKVHPKDSSVSSILFVQTRRVVSWGDDNCGGDSSCVQDQLQGIKEPNLGRERDMAQSYNQRNTYPSYLMTIPERSPKIEKMSYDWLLTVSCANDSMLFCPLNFGIMPAMLWGLGWFGKQWLLQMPRLMNTRLLPQRVRTQGAIWTVSPSWMVIWLRATDMD